MALRSHYSTIPTGQDGNAMVLIPGYVNGKDEGRRGQHSGNSKEEEDQHVESRSKRASCRAAQGAHTSIVLWKHNVEQLDDEARAATALA